MGAGEELGRLDARLVAALEGIGLLGEWSYDYPSRVFRSSPGVSGAFAIAPEDGLRGQPVELYERAVHPDDVGWLRTTRSAPPGHSGLRVTELRVIDAAGRERWIMVRGRFVLDAEDLPAFGYGVMFDVTDYNAGGERPFVAPAAPLTDPHFVLLESLAMAFRASRQLAQGAIERGCRALLFRVAELVARQVRPSLMLDERDEPGRRLH